MSSAAAPKSSKKSKVTKERVDPNQVVTDRIIEALEAGVVPWRCPWIRDSPVMPSNATTLHEYRGVNVLMLWLGAIIGGHASPYWLTFNQAKAASGAPRKGEKGTPCVRWVEWDRVLSDGEAAQAIAEGRKVRRDEKGRAVLRAMGPRAFTVFNVEQCDGLALQLPAVDEDQRAEWDAIDAAERLLYGMPDGPTIREHGDRAYYQPSTDAMGLPTRDRFTDPREFYLTAFHEQTHSTGHSSRLNRRDLAEAIENRNHAAYAREELTAEVGGAMLCARAGIEIPAASSASYIAGWLERLRGDSRLVITAAQHAQKAVDLIRGEAR
ncbi:MAG: zincin-like metallopeptidase domain-containing protein [Patulibacter sp.]|nr:zincin-like metallopeptidase domain-containing protein [Patulibacter sp.]